MSEWRRRGSRLRVREIHSHAVTCPIRDVRLLLERASQDSACNQAADRTARFLQEMRGEE